MSCEQIHQFWGLKNTPTSESWWLGSSRVSALPRSTPHSSLRRHLLSNPYVNIPCSSTVGHPLSCLGTAQVHTHPHARSLPHTHSLTHTLIHSLTLPTKEPLGSYQGILGHMSQAHVLIALHNNHKPKIWWIFFERQEYPGTAQVNTLGYQRIPDEWNISTKFWA